MFDVRSRLPLPPIDAVLTATDARVSGVITVVAALLVLIAMPFAVRDWRRSTSPIALLLLLGGFVTSLAEPFVDLLGGCWHPIHGQGQAFSLLNRPIPPWLVVTYGAYFGAQMMALYLLFRKGLDRRAMWLCFLVPVALDIVLEESLLGFSTSLYFYYGNQPLRLHALPLWWTMPNTMGIYLSAVLMVLLTPLLRGWRLMLVPFATLACYVTMTAVVAFPASMAVNSEFPAWGTQLAGLLTVLLSLLVVHACTRLVASNSGYRRAIMAALTLPSR